MKGKFIAISIIIILAVIVAYQMPNFRTTSLYDAAVTHFVVEDEIIGDQKAAMVEKGEILLSLPMIKQYVDPNVHWDEQSGKVIFTTKDKLVTMKTDKLTAMVNARPVDINMPVKIVDNIPYVPVQFLGELFDVEIRWVEKHNVVILDYKKSLIQKAETISEKARIRKAPTIKAPIIEKELKIGTVMRVFEEYENWYKVRTEDGLVGYIDKKTVKIRMEQAAAEEPDETAEAVWRPEKGKINLVWEYVGQKNPDTSKINPVDGLDVVSPTWFHLKDKQGTVSNLADMKYVQWAHDNGYKVWALFGNSSDKDLTHAVLSSADLREKMIQQLLIYAELYQLDGINIDFENVYLKDRDNLTQMVREMAPLMREQGLVVSIDVTIRSTSENWSMCYDRKALAEAADYIALMTYDQYWASSPEAGSVAQLSWVENGLKRVLEEVPGEKLLLGIPFYMREWKEERVGSKVKVSSKTLSMTSAGRIIAEKKLQPVWDEESGQYYAEYMEGNARYRIWLEDAKSINLKTSLVHKYDLAGAAAWRRGFENEQVWAVLQDNLKMKENYTQWANANQYNEMVFD